MKLKNKRKREMGGGGGRNGRPAPSGDGRSPTSPLLRRCHLAPPRHLEACEGSKMAHDSPDVESDGRPAPCLADAALFGVPGVLPSSWGVALDRSGITVSSKGTLTRQRGGRPEQKGICPLPPAPWWQRKKSQEAAFFQEERLLMV